MSPTELWLKENRGSEEKKIWSKKNFCVWKIFELEKNFMSEIDLGSKLNFGLEKNLGPFKLAQLHQ